MPDETPNSPIPASGAERLSPSVGPVRGAASPASANNPCFPLFCFAADDAE